MKYIAPNLYTFENLLVGRVYLIEDADGLTIIDGGIAQTANRLIRQITGSGRRLSDIKRILLTHAHPDHVGALVELQARSGAEVITSEIEKPYADGTLPIVRPDLESLSSWERQMPTIPMPKKLPTVDRTVSDGDVIEALGGLQVIATPGHSPGHVSFWQPERKILFVGDVIMNAFGLSGMRLPFTVSTPDMAENIRSVRKIAELDAKIVCFGHGEPITQDATAKIRAFATTI
ncbi:MAG: MBL fold metallo-hydrolase [Anaerolineae bacterium]